jgi:hypothetical protein
MHEQPDTDPEAADDDPPRVPIGESAAEDATAPTGLPPEQRRRGQTVDDDPERQETG